MKKAITELLTITGDNEEVKKWIKDWIIKLDNTQLILDTKYMSAEYSDFIKTQLIHNLAEEIVENMADYNVDKTSYSVSFIGLRRKKL